MDEIVTAIAEHAGALRFEALPGEVVHAAKQRLVDAFACAIGGRNCEAAVMGRRLAPGVPPAAPAGRILGSAPRTAADWAAFVNTAMIRYLDFNDVVHGGHPSDSLGAVLALADAAESDGKRFLTGMVVSYETTVRLIASMRLRERGFDQGVAIGIAAAAGAGHMLRLPPAQIANAIAITAVANVPLRATRVGQLSLWKGAATAFAARNAVSATLLAAEGMTGPEASFTGKNGVFEQVSGEFALEPFGARFLTPQVGLKYWPVENSAQAAVWAAIDLRKQVAPDAIAAIDIATSRAAWSEIGSGPEKWDPQTRETADHSLPYIFARALIDGGITVASFDRASYLDPSLRPLMARITVAQDDEVDSLHPAHVLLKVTARDTGGSTRRVAVTDPCGHPANPMNDAEIADKFRHLAEPALGKARAAAALEALWHIEREPRAQRLFDLIEPTQQG
jgi:2-methylcitrate dehydratase